MHPLPPRVPPMPSHVIPCSLYPLPGNLRPAGRKSAQRLILPDCCPDLSDVGFILLSTNIVTETSSTVLINSAFFTG